MRRGQTNVPLFMDCQALAQWTGVHINDDLVHWGLRRHRQFMTNLQRYDYGIRASVLLQGLLWHSCRVMQVPARVAVHSWSISSQTS